MSRHKNKKDSNHAEINKTKLQIVVGIDCGVNTGVAVWDAFSKKLVIVETMKIHQAYELIKELQPDLVRVEDARKRKWFGNSSREKLQGAGSIKRDSV